MRGWDFTMPLDPQSTVPIFVQIARALADDIRRGRLHAGDFLPGTRELARTLKVHRNTVITAYGELAAEGWITTERGRGTFVSRNLPDPRPRRFTSIKASGEETPNGFDLGPSIVVPSCSSQAPAAYNLAGWPDMRLLPTQLLARA